MELIYEYGFYSKKSNHLVSSRYLDKYLCSLVKKEYNPKEYSSLFESIIWFGISLYFEAKEKGHDKITEEIFEKNHPFKEEISNTYLKTIDHFLKKLFLTKYDFVVKICDH